MTRLLVALSPEEVDALDRLMAGSGDFVPGTARQRARAVGPLLLHGIELRADNERLREELDRLCDGEQALIADVARERETRREAQAGRDRTLNALKAERDQHARTRRRLRNARAAAAWLRTSRDAMHRQLDGVAHITGGAATD
ncbi:MAG: hypothetical protein F4Y86_00915 [Gammaproteobacteria bacterium]|nr:hypothetical protein [Gammaproteobacteria bacterium]MYB37009.1 hypothetical protein [Gammaproteobacteria bacterium]